MKLSAIQAALAELQLAPSKSLGQNFLHDQNLARWIVAQLGAGPGDTLLEIGPGLGALTGPALETGAELIAIEKDRRLANFLRQRFEGEARLQVENVDALEFDVRTLWPRRPVTVFGNLPYYISTPLLFHFASPGSPAGRAVFLLQRELAARIAASGPGSKDYGILSVVIGRRWRVELLRVLPAKVFLPEPKVDSALIRLVPREPGELPGCDASVFERLVRAGFSQRRKQLRNLLTEFLPGGEVATWGDAAAAVGVSQKVRGEDLSLHQWIALSNAVCPVDPRAAQDSERELFDVVDEHDVVTGVETRGVVHAGQLRHRAVHVFVVNAKGEVFLQRRSAWKDKHPCKWDSSASGHLDSGETYEAAARRELSEELGLPRSLSAGIALREVAALPASAQTDWEFIRLFQVTYEGPFQWPAAEIDWGGFFPTSVVEAWMASHPDDFAPGFLKCWRSGLRINETNFSNPELEV